MRFIPGSQHVFGYTAFDLRSLLDHYGIDGVFVRICGDQAFCLAITCDQRETPRELTMSAADLIGEHRGTGYTQ